MAIIEDTAKLQSLEERICEVEKELEKFYTDLGKAYFAKYAENLDPDFQSYAADINKANAEINGCNAQIKELKGIIACPGCGVDVNKTDMFCESCGARIAAPEPEVVAEPAVQVNTCTVCGEVLEEGSVFCTNCGTKVVAPVTEVAPAVQDTAPVCAVCGAPLEEDSVFCTMCGSKAEKIVPATELEVDTNDTVVEVYPPVVDTTPKCAMCGEVLEEGSVFCTNCGTKVASAEEATAAPVIEVVPEPVVEDTTPKCEVCGAVLDSDSAFCTICGTKVNVSAPVVEPVATPVVEEVFVPTEPVVVSVPVVEPVATPVVEEVFVPAEPVVVPPAIAPVEVAPAQPEVAEVPTKRFCVNCGKEIALTAKFCIYCGSKQ